MKSQSTRALEIAGELPRNHKGSTENGRYLNPCQSRVRVQTRRQLAGSLAGLLLVLVPVSPTGLAQSSQLKGEPQLRLAFVGQALIKNDLRKTAPLSVAQARDYLSGVDVAFTNLEVSVAAREAHVTPRSPTTAYGTPDVLDALRDMGFNLLSLANNHALDLGIQGIFSTQAEVDSRGFVRAGTGRDAPTAAAAGYLQTKAGRVALVAMASGATQLTPDTWATSDQPGVNFLELREDGTLNSEQKHRILDSVKEAAARGAFVIAYQHNHYWGQARGIDGPPGRERRIDRFDTPEWMEVWARELIDAGARIYVSHGNPALHGIEVYRGGLILYGLGNFIFQSSAGPDRYGPLAWESGVVKTSFEDGQVTSVLVRPLVLAIEGEGRGAPYLAQGGEAETILQRLAHLSQAYGTQIRIERETAEIVLPPGTPR